MSEVLKQENRLVEILRGGILGIFVFAVVGNRIGAYFIGTHGRCLDVDSSGVDGRECARACRLWCVEAPGSTSGI